MANSNPWFWGGKTRFEFEQEMQKTAVFLRSKNAPPTPVKKVDIEAVKARKNALLKSGVLSHVRNTSSVKVVVAKPVAPAMQPAKVTP